MKTVLVGYASTEGQTRKIARHVADHIVGCGVAVELLPLVDATDLDLFRFDAAILAASLHIGHYQREFSEFVSNRKDLLGTRPNLFLAVSLAAAGHEAEDWRGLDSVLSDLAEATGWQPEKIAHIAGAYVPSRYDIFRRLMMRRIIAERDPHADPKADKEYTDWVALDGLIDRWLSDNRLTE